ncbi:unnamed protein product [Ectocarpus sp. CCAP 1310/34]|nr:unnamed protein product [Ectocarpus sp. CCAP 1310/34]
MSENGPSSGAATPTPAVPPKKKIEVRAVRQQEALCAKAESKQTKFEERTGQCMVAASAEDNTRRAIERGSLTVVERTLEETKEELVTIPPKKKIEVRAVRQQEALCAKAESKQTKFEERTGQCMVAASAEDNTRRAIERGSLTVVERTLEETKEELVTSKKIVEESQAQPRCRRRRRRRCCCCCCFFQQQQRRRQVSAWLHRPAAARLCHEACVLEWDRAKVLCCVQQQGTSEHTHERRPRACASGVFR